jgi:hypothetical protein
MYTQEVIRGCDPLHGVTEAVRVLKGDAVT